MAMVQQIFLYSNGYCRKYVTLKRRNFNFCLGAKLMIQRVPQTDLQIQGLSSSLRLVSLSNSSASEQQSMTPCLCLFSAVGLTQPGRQSLVSSSIQLQLSRQWSKIGLKTFCTSQESVVRNRIDYFLNTAQYSILLFLCSWSVARNICEYDTHQ